MTANLQNLTGAVHVAPDTDQLFDDLAAALSAAALRALTQRQVFHLALSGGSTPEPFYVRLVTDPRYRRLPWKKTHVWLVDERRVPESDERSNMKMIRESLTDHVPIEPGQVHAVPTQEADPAAAYEQAMREAFPNVPAEGFARMDFMLLGMGGDGHTASLFPGSPAQDETHRWIANNQGDKVTPPPRITMTYPLLNAAREVAVLVVGRGKAEMVAEVAKQLATEPDPRRLPITGIDPTRGAGGELVWYLDSAAAGGAAL